MYAIGNDQVIEQNKTIFNLLKLVKIFDQLLNILFGELLNNFNVFRHHHGTGLERLECNNELYSDHDNITVLHVNTSSTIYAMRKEDVMNALCAMRSRNFQKVWILYSNDRTVTLIEGIFEKGIWKKLWKLLRTTFDCDKPSLIKGIVNLRNEWFPLLKDYICNNTELVAEVPIIKCKWQMAAPPVKYSAYCNPIPCDRIESSVVLESTFQETCVSIADLIDEGYNFLRVEASEIIAFVATDSDRIVKPGIPPHIPVAYGLRGASLPMNIMRNMVNDVRSEMHKRNTSVLCEVYDGQFHDLIVRSDDGKPLT